VAAKVYNFRATSTADDVHEFQVVDKNIGSRSELSIDDVWRLAVSRCHRLNMKLEELQLLGDKSLR